MSERDSITFLTYLTLELKCEYSIRTELNVCHFLSLYNGWSKKLKVWELGRPIKDCS